MCRRPKIVCNTKALMLGRLDLACLHHAANVNVNCKVVASVGPSWLSRQAIGFSSGNKTIVFGCELEDGTTLLWSMMCCGTVA